MALHAYVHRIYIYSVRVGVCAAFDTPNILFVVSKFFFLFIFIFIFFFCFVCLMVLCTMLAQDFIIHFFLHNIIIHTRAFVQRRRRRRRLYGFILYIFVSLLRVAKCSSATGKRRKYSLILYRLRVLFS